MLKQTKKPWPLNGSIGLLPGPGVFYITNAAGIDLTQAEGNQFNVLTGIILMKINEGGVNGQEFFGVYEPNASVGGFKGGTAMPGQRLKHRL
jgi:hypothetical protein